MADDIVRTVIEAVDNATGVIDKVGAGYEKLADDIDKANQTATRSASDVERSFASMAQALNSGSDTSAAQASIGALNEMLARGDISAETYGAAILQVGEQSGVMSQKSIEAADQMTALNQQLASGKITADQYAAGVKDVQDSLGSADTETKNFAESLTGLSTEMMAAIAGITAGLVTLKKGFDFAVEGAQINRIQEQFSGAMQSMGINAEEMMKRMNAAVRGTIDDEALAQVATRAFTQGIVTSGDTMVRVLELAHAKSVLLGKDTQEVFESLIQSTDMLSERGFKRLGINLPPLTQLVKTYAEQHNVAASSIDTETQKSILLNAALDKSKDAIDKANAAGDDQLTRLQRMDTTFKEVGDTIKVWFINTLSGSIEALDNLMTETQKFNDLMTKHETEMRKTAGTYKEYEIEVERSGLLTGTLTTIADDNARATARQAYDAGNLDGKYALLNDTIYEVTGGLRVLTAAQFDAERGAYGVAGALDESNRAARRDAEGKTASTDATLALKAAEDAASISISLLNSEIAGAVGNEMTSYVAKQSDLADKLAKTKTELDKLIGSQGVAITTTSKNVLSANELTAAQAKLADVTAVLGAHTQKSGESDTAFASRMAGLQVEADKLTGKITGTSSAVVKYVDNSKRISELKGTYDDLTKQIEANAAAHNEATRKILFNIAEQQAAVIADPTVRAQAMNALALQYGIVDQATKIATDEIIAANTRLAKDGNMPAYLATLQAISSGTLHLFSEDVQKPEKAIAAHNVIKKSFDTIPSHIQATLDRMAILSGNFDHMATQDPSGEGSGWKGGGRGPVAGLGKITTQADVATAHAILLSDQLNALPNIERYIHYKVNVDDLPTGGGPQPGPGAQHGADFIVPAGYPNDTFPLRVQSGERVIVQTPAQQSLGGKVGGTTFIDNTTMNIYNPLAAAMLMASKRRALVDHSNARMGG